MAGLQQYNFFPTDLFYPRPQPQPQPSSSTTPTLLPIQTPNPQDQTHHHHHQPPLRTTTINATPSTSSLVLTHKNPSLPAVPKFSSDPLSWLVWTPEDQDQDSQSF
ncbi:hypothetical protein VNO77_17042 [Canavalia gladiata]|uniref:Uncharacterized protein n=1 Tax=Canavalia gladiata TaxID=3824 RepID=A0AAN9QG89_CANGL